MLPGRPWHSASPPGQSWHSVPLPRQDNLCTLHSRPDEIRTAPQNQDNLVTVSCHHDNLHTTALVARATLARLFLFYSYFHLNYHFYFIQHLFIFLFPLILANMGPPGRRKRGLCVPPCIWPGGSWPATAKQPKRRSAAFWLLSSLVSRGSFRCAAAYAPPKK